MSPPAPIPTYETGSSAAGAPAPPATRAWTRRSSRSSRASGTSARSRRRAIATWPASPSRRDATRRPRANTRSSSPRSPKDGALRASYAGALGAVGDYGAALEQLTVAIELEPLNVEAYHNRAVIHERREERDAAIADYQKAVKYNPQYEPSVRALHRLGASLPQQPRSEAEKQATALAEEAAAAARRGDYAAAERKLDEAAKTAPKLALVYQYRANVAYLRGDTAGAAAALEEGLRIDPGNALFAENLRRLRQTPSAARVPTKAPASSR